MQDSQDNASRNYVEKEMGFRPYLDVLLRRRRLIAAATLLATLFGLLSAALTPPVYEARATVAIVKAKTDVAFGSTLNTVSDEDLAAAGAAQVLNATARRNAFQGLVKMQRSQPT